MSLSPSYTSNTAARTGAATRKIHRVDDQLSHTLFYIKMEYAQQEKT